MITTGSKWFYGLGILALLLAAAYGWTTGGNGLGPLTAGYKGAVGDHFGYGILLSTGLVSFFLGAVATVVRTGWYGHLPYPAVFLAIAAVALTLRLASL